MASVEMYFRIENPRNHGPGRNWTDFHYSVFFNDLSEIHRHLENGTDIDFETEDGETALHIACLAGDSNCIKAILKQNPAMNVAERSKNMTPLIMLTKYVRHTSEILKMMLEMGADPNLSQRDGDTPLHIIAKVAQEDRIRALSYAVELLKYKVNVNSKNVCGNTPLHIAIEKGFTAYIPILLKNGASLNIKNSCGSSPIQFAFHSRRRFFGPLDEIGKHLIIQISCKRRANPGLLNELCKFSYLRFFKIQCDQELAELKINVTDGTFVTYYDLLVSPLEIVAKYLRNEGTLRAVMAFDKEKYIFGDQLAVIVQDALIRNEATEIGFQFCEKVFPVILPDLCLDVIFKYLTNEDLRQLKKVTSS